MALERPEQGYVWLRVPLEGDMLVTVVGELHTWWSHWHRPPGTRVSQAVRCTRAVGVACAWCDAGYERRARYVLPVRHEGELRVVEFGRVQYSTLAMICGRDGGEVGSVLRLRRAWKAKNAEIQIFPAGREHVSPEVSVDIAEYVATLGLVQLKMLTPPKVDTLVHSEPPKAEEGRPVGPPSKRG